MTFYPQKCKYAGYSRIDNLGNMLLGLIYHGRI